MCDSKKLTEEFSSLYDYYIYHNLIQSLLLRKKGEVSSLAENNGAMLSWGISIFVGGEFSEVNGERVLSTIDEFDSPTWLYFPDDTWSSFVKSARSDKLKDKYLHLYQLDAANLVDSDGNSKSIVPVTREFIEQNLPNTEAVTDEFYSYTDREDFFQNGFGFALVIDGIVSGYCLSEYSLNNSHGINIWVDEQYRRLGYARKMVNAFLLHCQKKKQTAYWVCNDDNIPSNKLAVSSGFVLKSRMHYFEL